MKRTASRLHIQFIWLCTLLTFLIVCTWLILYSAMTHILQAQARDRVDSLIEQVAYNISVKAKLIEFYADTILKNQYTQRMLLEKNPYANYFNVQNFRKTVSTYTENNEELGSLFILNDKDVFLSINPVPSFYSVLAQLNREYTLFDMDGRWQGYTGPVYDAANSVAYYAYIQPIYDVSYGAVPQRKIGTLVFLNAASTIVRSIENFHLPDSYRVLTLSQDNEIIAGNVPSTADYVQEALSTLTYAEQQVAAAVVRNVQGIESLLQYKVIPQIGWKMLSAVPIDVINADLNRINAYCVVFILVIIAVIGIWYIITIRSFISPLKGIVRFAEKVPSPDLSERLYVKSRNEVGELAGCINRMLNRIDALVAQTVKDSTHIYELELTKKRVELSALQSQINPHFLYNSLDCLKGFGHLYGSPEVVEISSSIAHIMRYAIKGDEFVPVRDELTCMHKYLSIVSIRFDNRFKVDINIDPAILAERMPRFILQPVLENAVYHGLEPKPEGGILTIHGAWSGPDTMLFEVHDNGSGIPKCRLDEINAALAQATTLDAANAFQNRGIGLLNIHNRLKTMYGPGYGVVIDSTEGLGTIIRLMIARRKEG